MRVLVTGATGFIGTHLCRALAARGDSVVALVRTPAKAKKLPDTVEPLSGDLGLFAAADTVLPEVDVVVHLAGVVAAADPAAYEQINFTAVKDLVACLQRQDWTPRRLLFASSLAAAGPSPDDRPWTEDDAPAPNDPYGEAKMRAERAVATASFPTTSFRPPLVLGPDDSATLTLYRAASWGLGFRMTGPGQRLSFVDVRDLVSAILVMAEDRRDGHPTYFVSHATQIDVHDLWRGLGLAVGRTVRVAQIPRSLLRGLVPVATLGSKVLGITNQLDIKQYHQIAAPAFVCSSAALSGDLGWKATHGLDDALAHAAAGYRKSGTL